MPQSQSKTTILSMAVVAMGTAVLLHEGVGHGVTAWLRGDIPTQLTSNHLSSLRPDRWVDAGGTFVNLLIGALAVAACHIAGSRANLRYFCWILAAFNLFPGAGYFMFSGIFGFGDWQEVIRGLPDQTALRAGMTIFGVALYVLVARLLAVAVQPFCPRRADYNVIGRMPYLAGCLFSCAAGAFDPLGIKLFFVSTVPAAFGGSSGMLWLDSLIPRIYAGGAPTTPALVVRRAIAWWIIAALFAAAYIAILGRGIEIPH